MTEMTHFKDGSPRMVDVSEKVPTKREAVAEAFVKLPKEASDALEQGGVGKGDPLTVAQLAGIMAAKKTSELIPLCHPVPLSSVNVTLERVPGGVRIVSTARTTDRTGVEMEALTAASIAALTVYDMLKAVSKGIEISRIHLLSKTGGKSGDWRADSSLEDMK
jgi:cyclic pyranopterin monophosphate synthase